MSREKFEVIFDGPALSNHMMDVRDLAPALLALGNTIRRANQDLNGDKAQVNVLVDSGFEHGCFQVNLELTQHIIEQIKSFLADDDVKTAKDILEWLGLIGALGTGSVFGFLKLRRGRKIQSITEVKDSEQSGTITVQIEGDDNPVTINQTVYQLANDPKLVKPIKEFVSTTEKPGINEIRTTVDDVLLAQITSADARDIIESCEVVADQTEDPETSVVKASLRPYAPVFDEGEKWRFWYGGHAVAVDISDTTIAQDAITRGTVGIDDVYRVEMDISERRTPGGQFKHDYKVRRVLGFTPGLTQVDLFAPRNVIRDETPSRPQLPKPEEEKPQ